VAEIFARNGGGQGDGKLGDVLWPAQLGGEGNERGVSSWAWMQEGEGGVGARGDISQRPRGHGRAVNGAGAHRTKQGRKGRRE
jgi:hypothetical protein